MNKQGEVLAAGAQGWLLRERAKVFREWVRPDAAVLEFGPRDIWNLRSIECREKYACFPRMKRAILEREGVGVIETAAELNPRFADFAFCHGMLEYQLDPREIIVHLKRALKPDGLMAIHALYDPAFRNPRLDKAAEHYYSWNVQTLGNLLVDCGFEFVRGGLCRYPREEVVLAKEGNHRLAALFSRFFDPLEQVQVVARNSA